MNKNYTLHGYAALRIARRDGVTLYYGGTRLAKDARVHVYAPLRAYVTPDGWLRDTSYPLDAYDMEEPTVDSFFHESRYLGPDENGIEPRWKDA